MQEKPASSRKPDFGPNTFANMQRDFAAALKCDVENLPAVFQKPYVKVLQIGAFEALLKRFPDADSAALRRTLSRYCFSYQYRRALVYRKNRHDLDGNNVEEINEAARKHAEGELEKAKARRKRRKEHDVRVAAKQGAQAA